MSMQIALEEYGQALRKGQKEYRERMLEGRPAHPLVLDEILPEISTETVVDIGLVDIPAERIVGVKSSGRITAFSASFLPLLGSLCQYDAVHDGISFAWRISLCSRNKAQSQRTPILYDCLYPESNGTSRNRCNSAFDGTFMRSNGIDGGGAVDFGCCSDRCIFNRLLLP